MTNGGVEIELYETQGKWFARLTADRGGDRGSVGYTQMGDTPGGAVDALATQLGWRE